MGTTVEVVGDDPEGVDATRRLFTEMEQRFSRFLPDSELSRINRDPRHRVPLSESMEAVLGIAIDLGDRTDGLVDPAVGGLVEAWGYDRTFEELIEPAGAPQDLDRPHEWSLDGSLLVRPPGLTLDLGGIVKGWTADLAVERGYASVVSAGGDVRSCLPDTIVAVVNPSDGSTTRVGLGSGGLATSSVARRKWLVGDEAAHHIIDPRTGAPASTPVVSATARCATAVEAEAAAKTALILGPRGLAWADERSWIASALVTWADGSVFATQGWEMAA